MGEALAGEKPREVARQAVAAHDGDNEATPVPVRRCHLAASVVARDTAHITICNAEGRYEALGVLAIAGEHRFDHYGILEGARGLAPSSARCDLEQWDFCRRELLEETGFTAVVNRDVEKQGANGASDGVQSGTERAVLPNLLAWPDPWKSRENYHCCHLSIDGNDPANEPGSVSQVLEPGEHIVPILMPLVDGGSSLINQLKQASAENDWLLEARLSGIAQGMALASQLRGRL